MPVITLARVGAPGIDVDDALREALRAGLSEARLRDEPNGGPLYVEFPQSVSEDEAHARLVAELGAVRPDWRSEYALIRDEPLGVDPPL